MDGDLSLEEFDQASGMILKATDNIAEIQRNALTSRYSVETIGDGE